MKVSFAGLTIAAVVATLYNAAAPRGMGFLAYDAKPWTEQDAQAVLAEQDEHYEKHPYGPKEYDFDYVGGRPIKVTINPAETEFEAAYFDRDNGGEGTAQDLLQILRQSGNPADPRITGTSKQNMTSAITSAKKNLMTEPWVDKSGPIPVLRMGTSDVADKLGPAIAAAEETLNSA